MAKGKLIVIAGTDCSGKETQTKKLVKYLQEKNINVSQVSFPMYDTPTGQIIGSSYLGKPHMGKTVFPEGAVNVPPIAAGCLFASDRSYNSKKIIDALNKGVNVISDRYVSANLGHQGGKIKNKEIRKKLYIQLSAME